MANIKLKDRNGTEQTYSGITQLSLPTAEGSTVIFSEGSGGGSSLPAGVYCLASLKVPTRHWQKWFTYNGELYAFANSVTSTANPPDLYKYDESTNAWTKILSKPAILPQYITPSDKTIEVREFGGVAHIFGNSIHTIFDGSTITAKANCPHGGEGTSIVPFNGTFYAIGSTGTVETWDEATDTWETLTTYDDNEMRPWAFVCNDSLYFIQTQTVYKYNGSTFEVYDTLGSGSTREYPHKYDLVVIDNVVYFVNIYNELCKYDAANKQITLLGRLPEDGVSSSWGTFIVYNGKLRLSAGSYGYSGNSYELNIIEE